MPVRRRRRHPLRRVASRALLTGMVLSTVVPTLTACESAPPAPPGPAWQAVPLRDGLQPVVVAPADAGLVVGAHSPARPHARLLTLVADQLADVKTVPESPYAFEGRWLSLAVHGTDVVAVAGARGGAHANYRWTVWRGTLGGERSVAEQPQPFGVFGGWGAGDLTGVAFAGDVPVIAGAWASDRTGNDVSLWTSTGSRWARQSSTGTPLGSTPTELLGARGIASTGPGLVLTGAVTDLQPGRVATVPALWLAGSPDGPWSRVRLPATSSLAEAHAATCDVSSCLVVGVDGGLLAVWEVTGGVGRRLETPRTPVAEKVSLVVPVSVAGRDVVLVPGATLERDGTEWTAHDGPPDTPVSAAAVGETLYVVSQDSTGTTRLWAARP